MNHDDKRAAFLDHMADWLHRPAAFPLPPGRDVEDEETVFVFDWHCQSEEDRAGLLSSLFGDCKPTHFSDLCEITPVPIDDKRTIHRRTLRPNWLPFAATMVDLDECAEWVDEGFTGGIPQFSQLLFVNLDELDGDRTPIYTLAVSGTAIPKPSIPPYGKTIGELGLVDPAGG